MYRTFLTLEGTIENVAELNENIEKETGIADFFDAQSEEWRAWVEYKDGKTMILEEVAR